MGGVDCYCVVNRRGAVLVNRGWVPATWLDDIKQVSAAHDAQPAAADQQPAPAASAAAASTSKGGGWFGRGKAVQQQQEATSAPAVAAVQVWDLMVAVDAHVMSLHGRTRLMCL